MSLNYTHALSKVLEVISDMQAMLKVSDSVLRSSACTCRNDKQSAAQAHGNAHRGSRFRHAVSLMFAANPLRTHREWTGVLERASPEPVVARPATPKVCAFVRCLHRDFGSTSGR